MSNNVKESFSKSQNTLLVFLIFMDAKYEICKYLFKLFLSIFMILLGIQMVHLYYFTNIEYKFFNRIFSSPLELYNIINQDIFSLLSELLSYIMKSPYYMFIFAITLFLIKGFFIFYYIINEYINDQYNVEYNTHINDKEYKIQIKGFYLSEVPWFLRFCLRWHKFIEFIILYHAINWYISHPILSVVFILMRFLFEIIMIHICSYFIVVKRGKQKEILPSKLVGYGNFDKRYT